MNAPSPPPPSCPETLAEADVVIAGCGFAGAMAAIAAHDAGAVAVILEKMPTIGGISVCSAGGVRYSPDAEAAFAYLSATNAGTTPAPVLRALAAAMPGLPALVRELAAVNGAVVTAREAPANYPFPGHDRFGFVYVESVPGFDPAQAFPTVRGAAAGARLFKVVADNLAARGIRVLTGCAARRLVMAEGEAAGLLTDRGLVKARRGVVLATGGFEAAADLQRQFWPSGPLLSAAVRGNTGDGLRMAQSAGAQLWHMWHLHGSYGFRHPDPAYPFGIRVKRLPDWTPGRPFREDVRMAWILLDRQGRRFMNEYDPYLQDTGHRPFEALDPATQSRPRLPALLLVDEDGRRLYPLGAPTWHDGEVAQRHAFTWSRDNLAEVEAGLLFRADTLEGIAQRFGRDAATLKAAVADWNRACAAGADAAFGRPAASMVPIAKPPFIAAEVWPVVSNTQGGPAHDERQRVLDAHGAPIPRLYEAGEIGSVFGHLYMSGGNIAECFVGGPIAGREAAGLPDR
ncbi:MAG: hypothetical protein OHK0024_12650 [Thalassobaculales bacterium]